jgi:hypothetical protein
MSAVKADDDRWRMREASKSVRGKAAANRSAISNEIPGT